MLLDTRTLVVVLVGIGILLSGAAFLTWRAHRHIVALLYWASGSLLGVCGMALVVVYDQLPAAFAIPISNTAVAATYVLIWFGVRSFAGRPVPMIPGAVILALWSGSNSWFLFVQNDIVVRILLGSAGICGLSFLTAFELWRMAKTRRRPRKAKRATALIFLGHGLFVAVRAALIAAADPLSSVLSPSLLQSIGFLEAILAVTAWSVGFLAMTSERLQRELDRMATIDTLTGTYNRRAFLELAERDLARAQRMGQPLALLRLDIDHFKRINDRFGRTAGDALLKLFTEAVRGRLRGADLFGRFGGEEFCILLPNTDAVGAKAFAEGLCRDVAGREMDMGDDRITISLSVGIAVPGAGGDLDAALSAADSALYQAKRNGRDQVVLAVSPAG